MNLERILIFRIGHLGDTLIALPALWAIRDKFPGAHLTLLTNIDMRNPNYISPRDVLPSSGLVDETLAYPTNLGPLRRRVALISLVAKIRQRRFDAAIYLMPRIRSGIQIDRDLSFFRLCGIRQVLGAEYVRSNALTLPIPKPTPTVTREADFLLDLLASIGLPTSGSEMRTDLLLDQKERASAISWLENEVGERHTGRKLLAIAPASKWRSKVWPEGRFADVVSRLIDRSAVYPIVFGGPEDKAVGDRLVAKWQAGANAAGALKIRESAALLERCSLYLGNDTGTMHLAAAVGTPCVATFAAIDWKDRWLPVGADHEVFRKSVACEGCLTPDCFNHHECLDLITVDEVYQACASMIGDADPDR
ncbi:MAG: glycosyltransferase family 9 protein [Pyrinomonadaceae bacterium]